MQVALQGIPNIRKVSIREAKRVVPEQSAPDGYTNDTEWMLDTEGVNLQEVRPPQPAAMLEELRKCFQRVHFCCFPIPAEVAGGWTPCFFVPVVAAISDF